LGRDDQEVFADHKERGIGINTDLAFASLIVKRPKAVVFDVDGVLVHGGKTTTYIMERFNVPRSRIDTFFKIEFADCLVGKADLKSRIGPLVESLNTNMSGKEFVNEWIANSCQMDSRFRPIIQELDRCGLMCAIATNQERWRSEALKKSFGKLFHRFFSSADLGVAKPEQGFFTAITESIGVEPQNILFFDDRTENVESAKRAGWSAELFSDFESCKDLILQTLLSES